MSAPPPGSARALLAETLHAAWYLLFPNQCVGCEASLGPADHGAICRDCRERLPLLSPPWCDACGLPLGSEGRCDACTTRPPAFDVARAALPYEPVVQDLVHAFKLRGALRLASLFGELAAGVVAAQRDVLETGALGEVPLLPADLRKRGRNHAAEIARALSRRTGIPHRPLLVKTRRTEPQATLDRERRARNVAEVFAVRPSAAVPSSYLLVDDVLTTGATADACARALKAAGVARVAVVTVARTLRD